MTMRILSLTGALLMALAVPHAAEPPMVELTPDGHLLLTDSGFEQVLELDLEGNVLGRYGGPGKAPSQFGLIHWIALAPDGAIFVTEVFNWRVQRLVPSDE